MNLFQKMKEEQEQYRNWLLSLPAEEILHHTFEYTVREDIMMAMEDIDLTEVQKNALLEVESPLATVFYEFRKRETDHMETVCDCIESVAKRQQNSSSDFLHNLTGFGPL